MSRFLLPWLALAAIATSLSPARAEGPGFPTPIDCAAAFQQLPDRSVGMETLRPPAPPSDSVGKTIAALTHAARAIRDRSTLLIRRVFRYDFPINILEDGTNVKADYFARALMGRLSPKSPKLDVNEIAGEVDKLISSTLGYKQTLDGMLDKEAQYRLQIDAMSAALEKISSQGLKGPYDVWLPIVKDGQVPSLWRTEFEDTAGLSSARASLRSALKKLTSSGYETPGSYENVETSQVIDLQTLDIIRRQFNRVVAQAQRDDANVKVPPALQARLDAINAILDPRGDLNGKIDVQQLEQAIGPSKAAKPETPAGEARTAGPAAPPMAIRLPTSWAESEAKAIPGSDLAPPAEAFQKVHWIGLRKTLRAALRVYHPRFSATPNALPKTVLGRAWLKIKQVASSFFSKGGSSAPGAGNDYQHLVDLFKSLTPEQQAALGLSRPVGYVAIAQTGKWGVVISSVTTAAYELWTPGQNYAIDAMDLAFKLFFATDAAHMRACAADLNEQAYALCVTGFIKSKFLPEYMNQIENENPGVRLNRAKNEVIIDPKRVPEKGAGLHLTRDPKTGVLSLDPALSPEMPAETGLSNDPKTRAVLIDPKTLPPDASNAIIGRRPDGTIALHVASFVELGSGGMLQVDSATGAITLSPEIEKVLVQIAQLHNTDEMYANTQKDIESSVSNGIQSLTVTSPIAVEKWVTADASTFQAGILAYFGNLHGAYGSALAPALKKIAATTDQKQQGAILQQLGLQIPPAVVIQVCSLLARREKGFQCPVTEIALPDSSAQNDRCFVFTDDTAGGTPDMRCVLNDTGASDKPANKAGAQPASQTGDKPAQPSQSMKKPGQ